MIHTELIDCPPLSTLEPIWRALEAQADASFFQSWTWIGSWLHTLPETARPRLLRATEQGAVVGLALLGQRRQRRHGFVHSRSLYLHASGDRVADSIAVEYNGFLMARERVAEVEPALLDHLLTQVPAWDELFLPGILQAPARAETTPGTRWQSEVKPYFFIDLAKVREKNGDYLAILPQQRRYHIRKSEKAFAKLGEVEFRVAETLEEALGFLDGLKVLHQPYWEGRGQPGAFASEFAQQFHRRLITEAFPAGAVQLMRVMVAGRELGYLYNFVYRGRVMNYQSGIDYDMIRASSISPGLLCHARAVKFCSDAGFDVYDFMAGEFRYKRWMCTDTGAMQWAVLQRDRLRFRVEDLLRGLKHRLKRPDADNDSAEAPAAESSEDAAKPAASPASASAPAAAADAVPRTKPQAARPAPPATPAPTGVQALQES